MILKKIILILSVVILVITGCKKDDNPTSSEPGPTVEYSGATYHTVKIGNQYWLKENLNVGTIIKGNTEQKNNGQIEKYCYDDNPENCKKYGGLYQWDEAMQYSNNKKGICPSGWHIPSHDEFQILAKSVNGDGNSLKAVGEGYGNGAGTNTTGFSVLLAGRRETGGYFQDIQYYPFFWSTTNGDNSEADYFYIPYMNNYTGGWNTYPKDYGLSIRCVKD